MTPIFAEEKLRVSFSWICLAQKNPTKESSEKKYNASVFEKNQTPQQEVALRTTSRSKCPKWQGSWTKKKIHIQKPTVFNQILQKDLYLFKDLKRLFWSSLKMAFHFDSSHSSLWLEAFPNLIEKKAWS